MAQLRVNKLVLCVITFFIVLTYLIFIRNSGEDQLVASIRRKYENFQKQREEIRRTELPETVIKEPIGLENNNNQWVKFANSAEFLVNVSYLLKLEQKRNNLLDTFDKDHRSLLKLTNLDVEGPSETTSNSYCECGRISEPCQCCANLTINRFPHSSIHRSIYSNLIIGKNNAPILYCFNLQFKVMKNIAFLTSFILENNSKFLQLDNKLIEFAFKSKENTKSFIFTDQTFGDIHKKYELCTTSSAAQVMLCLYLHSMDYSVNSQSNPPETSFTACSHLELKHTPDYILSIYNFGCFKAHKGAVADADTKTGKEKLEETPLPNLNANTSAVLNLTSVLPIIIQDSKQSLVSTQQP
ncbi:hypothetical protein Ciccas_001354 [Cichlidogyrus casuarinus]|uniref:DUF4773 domain-containing protein n=1 Tax=Cichlidogyrus casuarinus TaxID=1844966 RepID=A0ABD2QND7_9PLAT